MFSSLLFTPILFDRAPPLLTNDKEKLKNRISRARRIRAGRVRRRPECFMYLSTRLAFERPFLILSLGLLLALSPFPPLSLGIFSPLPFPFHHCASCLLRLPPSLTCLVFCLSSLAVFVMVSSSLISLSLFLYLSVSLCLSIYLSIFVCLCIYLSIYPFLYISLSHFLSLS